VLCGPGNNGGDGYGIAGHLAAAGVAVTVAATAAPRGEPAATMAARWVGAVVPLAQAPPAPLIIDALFGSGLARPLGDDVDCALDRVRGAGRVVAIDIASGIDADTGAVLGRPLQPHLTLALGALKPAHVLEPAAHGRMAVVDIGIAPASDTRLVAPPRRLPLAASTHKFARGWVLVVEGASAGAAGLAGLAALRSGAGLVTLVGDGAGLPALAMMRRPETDAATLLADGRVGAVVVGPGLHDGARARAWLDAAQAAGKPLVIDAGALACLDGRRLAVPALLTPHEGEFARAFGAPGADRLAAVRAAAAVTQAVVLLKGPATIIAAPDGRVAINTHAAPWLATAGAGDVLAGIAAGLMAQGLDPFDAAGAAAWLHGDAGRRLGPGAIADDLLATLPAVLAAL
jgi:hydroxyethylthiazole kinase-like uncharacterized protein yjeF